MVMVMMPVMMVVMVMVVERMKDVMEQSMMVVVSVLMNNHWRRLVDHDRWRRLLIDGRRSSIRIVRIVGHCKEAENVMGTAH